MNRPSKNDKLTTSQKPAPISGSNGRGGKPSSAVVGELFSEELAWVEKHDLNEAYFTAIQRVAICYGMDLRPARIKALVAGLGALKIDEAGIREAADRLMRSENFRETVRYGGSLQPQDFLRALQESRGQRNPHADGQWRRHIPR